MQKMIIASAVLLSACVSLPDVDQGQDLQQVETKPSGDVAEIGQLIAKVDSDIVSEEKAFEEEELAADAQTDDEVVPPAEADEQNSEVEGVAPLPQDAVDPLKVPMEVNARVEYWVDYFSNKDHERFQRFLNRGEKYRAQVVKILRESGVPTELYYLAMIESGYVTEAKSHASAVGAWQFMPATGKRYGLERNSYLDERVDPFRATMAAAAYLKDLNRVFQSWYLAMAAYNAGEMRILQSIMKCGSRNFWEMVQRKALPKETMDYVPKFLAAAIIGRDPAKFGFEIEKGGAFPELVSVTVPSPIHLSAVASATGISLDSLKEYNPHLRRSITPPGDGEYQIWVPTDHEDSVATSQETLARGRLRKAPAPVIEESNDPSESLASGGKFHRVRRGETVASIAKKHGLTKSQLRHLNGLRSNRLIVGAKLRVVPAKDQVLAKAGNGKALPKKYRVRRGDSLAKIATKFGVSVNHLKKINGFRSSHGLRVGQLIQIASLNQNSAQKMF